jgi:hypothetical protein
MQPILDIANLADRREAAEAVADGAALFYAFGNFAALAALPDRASVRAVNALKGRPLDQVGSVTTTPERARSVFDWERVTIARDSLLAVMAELEALGPIGFRGPASDAIPDHLTQVDGDVRTVQLIVPGDACPSNGLVGQVLDLTGDDFLFITSANTSSNVTGQVEAAHYELREIQREFGDRDGVVLIGHRNEARVRRRYPHHLPCSTSIVAFHTGKLVLERLGSLDADTIARAAARHGLGLRISERAHERVPVRRPARRRPFARAPRLVRAPLALEAGA